MPGPDWSVISRALDPEQFNDKVETKKRKIET